MPSKVFDEAGAEIVDFSKKYTKNAAKALDEFGGGYTAGCGGCTGDHRPRWPRQRHL